MKPAAAPGESGRSRAMTALTHALPWILAVGLATRIASWFGALTLLDLAFAVVILAASFAARHHSRSTHLCERCIAEVPADAPVRAQRRKKLLWFSHLMSTRIGLGGLLAPVTALGFVGIVFGSPAIKQAVRAPLDVIMFATVYTGWLHHQLQPWCPYCRDWDEGGDPEPSPDPSEFTTRTGH